MIPVRSVKLSIFVHPSESLEKIKKALFDIFSVKFKEKNVDGEFGTTIVELNYVAKRKRDIKNIVDKIFTSLDKKEVENLLDSISLRTDEHGNFYVRLSKYSIVNGKLSLADESNSIQVIMSFEAYPASRENYFSVIRDFLEKFINNH